MSEIILPSDGNGKKAEEEKKDQLLFQATAKGEGVINISIGNGVQLRDVSHAIRILNLMVDGKIAQQQVAANANKVQPVPHGIINNLRRGFRR